MRLAHWFKTALGLFSQEDVVKPRTHVEYLQDLLRDFEKHDHLTSSSMGRVVNSRHPDIYHLIKAIQESEQNMRARATLPRDANPPPEQAKRYTLKEYITDFEGRTSGRTACFTKLAEETASLLKALEQCAHENEYEYRHYLRGLESLIIEATLVIETYLTTVPR